MFICAVFHVDVSPYLVRPRDDIVESGKPGSTFFLFSLLFRRKELKKSELVYIMDK